MDTRPEVALVEPGEVALLSVTACIAAALGGLPHVLTREGVAVEVQGLFSSVSFGVIVITVGGLIHEQSLAGSIPAAIGVVAGSVFLPTIRALASRPDYSTLPKFATGGVSRMLGTALLCILYALGEGVAMGASFRGSEGYSRGISVVICVGLHNMIAGYGLSESHTSRGANPARAMRWAALVFSPQALIATAAFLAPEEYLSPMRGFGAGVLLYAALDQVAPDAMAGAGQSFAIVACCASCFFRIVQIFLASLGPKGVFDPDGPAGEMAPVRVLPYVVQLLLATMLVGAVAVVVGRVTVSMARRYFAAHHMLHASHAVLVSLGALSVIDVVLHSRRFLLLEYAVPAGVAGVVAGGAAMFWGRVRLAARVARLCGPPPADGARETNQHGAEEQQAPLLSDQPDIGTDVASSLLRLRHTTTTARRNVAAGSHGGVHDVARLDRPVRSQVPADRPSKMRSFVASAFSCPDGTSSGILLGSIALLAYPEGLLLAEGALLATSHPAGVLLPCVLMSLPKTVAACGLLVHIFERTPTGARRGMVVVVSVVGASIVALAPGLAACWAVQGAANAFASGDSPAVSRATLIGWAKAVVGGMVLGSGLVAAALNEGAQPAAYPGKRRFSRRQRAIPAEGVAWALGVALTTSVWLLRNATCKYFGQCGLA
ncbi:unnamed protein product [Pedinophyceae sp. YPF-701]|nr:unnamed protein product [Pedinophyceae sp. YPF-701]